MTESGAMIYIVDDDEAIRSGLTMLLRSYGYDVHAFPSGQAFLDHCTGPLPERGAAILDLSMPAMTGVELQWEMRRRNIDLPVVFLSGEADVPVAVEALQHGAVDFIEKPVDSEILLDRIGEALDTAGDDTGADEDPGEIESRLDTLTTREREVLEGIAGGKTSRAIAIGLEISERTVELHRSRILKKMCVRNSSELLNHVLPALGRSGGRE